MLLRWEGLGAGCQQILDVHVQQPEALKSGAALSPCKACGGLMLPCLYRSHSPTESATPTFPLYVRPRVVEMTSGAR